MDVLLVDDEPNNLYALSAVLEDLGAGQSEKRAVTIPEGGRARVVFARSAVAAGVRRYRASVDATRLMLPADFKEIPSPMFEAELRAMPEGVSSSLPARKVTKDHGAKWRVKP